jgi:hypothetical protein
MSITILLDKSALQRLNQDELQRLSHHYIVAAPQVLIFELLGDLSKDGARPEKSEAMVQALSRNLRAAMPKVCADTREMAFRNLLGHPVPLTGQIPMSGGIPIVDGEGKHGVVFDEPPEMEAMFRWHLGRFTEDERAQSLYWRQSTKALDMEAFQKMLRKIHPKLDGIKTIPQVVSYVDQILAAPSHQRFFANWASIEARAGGRLQESVLQRWDHLKPTSFFNFAPYAHHFLRVSMAFYVGLRVGAITTRKSNWIDVEYLRYLPFCKVFSTGDQLQVDMARELMSQDQDMIAADDLKADMARLIAWWNSLSKEDKHEEAAEYGQQPPDFDGSPTATLWRKTFGPRKKGRGNLALKMTPEQNKALFEKLRPQMETAQAALARAKKAQQNNP